MTSIKQLESVLRPVIISCLFVVPFVALYISGSLFFPYITGKGLVFRFLVEIALAAWLVLAILKSEYRPRRSYVLWSVVAAVGILMLATIAGADPVNSFWSNFERMEGLVTFFHLLAYFVVLVSVMKTEKLWHRFLNTNILVSVLVAIYGLFQLGGALAIMQGGSRLDATLGNAGYLGGYMLMSFFVTAYLLNLKWADKAWRYVYLAVMILQAFILFQTATRGSLLGLVGGCLIVLISTSLGRHHRQTKKISLVLLTITVLSVGGFYLAKDSSVIQNQPVLARLANISLTDTTTQSRFIVWGMSYEAFKERPILGWGPENFYLVWDKYYDPRMYNQEPWFDRSHNVVFDWLVAGGFLGLLAYLAIFGSAVWFIVKDNFKWFKKEKVEPVFNSWQQGILLAFLASYFFHNLFIFDNIVSYGLFITILAFIHVKVTEKDQTNLIWSKDISGKNPDLGAISLLATLFLLLPSLYLFVLSPTLAASNLSLALKQEAGGDFAGSLQSFERVFSYSLLGRRQTEEQLLSMASKVVVSNTADEEVKNGFVNLVNKEVVPSLNSQTNLVKGRLIYVDYLLRLGKRDEAIRELEELRTLSPKRQLIVSNLAYVNLIAGNEDEALTLAKESVSINPDNPEVRTLEAFILLSVGREAEAKEVLAPISDSLAINDNRFLTFFFQQKRYDLVIEILEKKLASNPADLESWSNLALVFYTIGNKTQALTVLDEAVGQNEGFKDQAEKIKQAIREDAIDIN